MNAIREDLLSMWVTRTAREAIERSNAIVSTLVRAHARQRRMRVGYFRTAHMLSTGETIWVATNGQGHAVLIAPCRSFDLSDGRDRERDVAVEKVINCLLQTTLSYRGAQERQTLSAFGMEARGIEKGFSIPHVRGNDPAGG